MKFDPREFEYKKFAGLRRGQSVLVRREAFHLIVNSLIVGFSGGLAAAVGYLLEGHAWAESGVLFAIAIVAALVGAFALLAAAGLAHLLGIYPLPGGVVVRMTSERERKDSIFSHQPATMFLVVTGASVGVISSVVNRINENGLLYTIVALFLCSAFVLARELARRRPR